MDFKTLIGTCAAIFLAEMGDKTQLAVFGAAAATQKPVEVFLGAVAGLALVTLLAVWAGQAAGHLIPLKFLRMAGGMLFVGIGITWILKARG